MITPELVAHEQARTYVAERDKDIALSRAAELRRQVDLLIADNLALREDLRRSKGRVQQLEKNNRRALNHKDAQLCESRREAAESRARRAASLASRNARIRPPGTGAYAKHRRN